MNLKPTLAEAFAIGKVEGSKEAFREILQMIQIGDLKHVELYLRARLKTIEDSKDLKNPFKGDIRE